MHFPEDQGLRGYDLWNIPGRQRHAMPRCKPHLAGLGWAGTGRAEPSRQPAGETRGVAGRGRDATPRRQPPTAPTQPSQAEAPINQQSFGTKPIAVATLKTSKSNPRAGQGSNTEHFTTPCNPMHCSRLSLSDVTKTGEVSRTISNGSPK